MGKYPPGPKGHPLLGSLIPFMRDMPDFLVAAREEYGDLCGFNFTRRRAVLVSDPDLVEQVLVTDARFFEKSHGLQRMKNTLGEGLLTSEGAFHLRQRRISSKAFAKSRVSAYGDCMAEFAQDCARGLVDGQTVDVAATMMHLTLRIVAKTLFDSDSTEDAEVVERSLTELQRLFPFLLMPFSEKLEKFPFPWVVRFRRAKEDLDAIIYRIIAERRENPEDRGDLLSMLMLARDEEGDGSGMDDTQLRDECLTNFLAGHETTANALAWSLYLLSNHPSEYQKLMDEVDEVLQGRPPGSADFPKLIYTRMVVAESLRIYPPAFTLGRTPIENYDLSGYTIKPGAVVFISPYVNQRDPKWFPDPLVFDPSRFAPGREKERPKYSYFPFGGGVRKCIGERFAWMEMVLVLATLSQHCRFHYDSGRPIKTWASVTLRPENGLPMRVVRR